MRLISTLLKRVVYPALSATGYLRPRGCPDQLAILTYHGVRPEDYAVRDAALDGHLVTAGAFRSQLRLLKKLYRVISPEDFRLSLKGIQPLPPISILLTCDDGLLNAWTDMLPILQEEGVPCLFFVTGASTGELRTMLWYEDLFLLFLEAKAGSFDISCEGVRIAGDLGSAERRRASWCEAMKRLSTLDVEGRDSFIRTARAQLSLELESRLESKGSAWRRRFGLLTATELRHVASAGMTIGAHTLSHPMLSLASPEVASAEISGSKLKLEAILGTPVWAFAYPFGDSQSVNGAVVKMTRDAGFEAAFLNYGGGFGAALPQFSLPRLHITADMNLAEFQAHVSGFHRRLQRYAGRSSEALTMAQA